MFMTIFGLGLRLTVYLRALGRLIVVLNDAFCFCVCLCVAYQDCCMYQNHLRSDQNRKHGTVRLKSLLFYPPLAWCSFWQFSIFLLACALCKISVVYYADETDKKIYTHNKFLRHGTNLCEFHFIICDMQRSDGVHIITTSCATIA